MAQWVYGKTTVYLPDQLKVRAQRAAAAPAVRSRPIREGIELVSGRAGGGSPDCPCSRAASPTSPSGWRSISPASASGDPARYERSPGRDRLEPATSSPGGRRPAGGEGATAALSVVLAELDYLLATRVASNRDCASRRGGPRRLRLQPFEAADIAIAAEVIDTYADLEVGLADASIVSSRGATRCSTCSPSTNVISAPSAARPASPSGSYPRTGMPGSVLDPRIDGMHGLVGEEFPEIAEAGSRSPPPGRYQRLLSSSGVFLLWEKTAMRGTILLDEQ